MKLIKKLLIVTLLLSMLASVPTRRIQNPSCKTMLLSDKNTEPVDYNKTGDNIIKPKSLPSIKAI